MSGSILLFFFFTLPKWEARLPRSWSPVWSNGAPLWTAADRSRAVWHVWVKDVNRERLRWVSGCCVLHLLEIETEVNGSLEILQFKNVNKMHLVSFVLIRTSDCDFLSWLLKNILHQHLLLGAGESDTSVARQPLWLLFCRAGPLTRFSPPLLLSSQGCITLFWCLCSAEKCARIKEKHAYYWCARVRSRTRSFSGKRRSGQTLLFMLYNNVFWEGEGGANRRIRQILVLTWSKQKSYIRGFFKREFTEVPTQSAAVLQVSQARHVLAFFFPPWDFFWIMNIQISPLSIRRKIGPLFPTSSEKHLFFSPSRNKLTDFRDIYDKVCVFPVAKES